MWNPLPGIAENLLTEGLVTALVGAGFLGWMKRRGSPWLRPLLVGLSAVGIILISFAALKVLTSPVLDKHPQATPENIETLVGEWLNNFKLTVRNDPTDGMFFRKVVTAPSGSQIIIGRSKVDRENYIPTDQSVLNRMSLEQVAQLRDEISLEMARAKAQVTYQDHSLVMTLAKRIPLTNALTENDFISALEDLNDEINLVRETMRIAIRRSGVLR